MQALGYFFPRNFSQKLLLLLILIFIRSNSFANMANPDIRGYRLGEVSGALRQLHIEHEDLRIDLRPIEQSDPALVRAEYQIRNDSSERDVELVFIGVNMEHNTYQVLFDDKPVSFVAGFQADLPDEWKDPSLVEDNRYIPIDSYDSENRSRDRKNTLRFTLHITTGKHRVVVTYSSLVAHNIHQRPVITWKCRYILAPAKRWASFGTLHTTILLPQGWGSTTTIEPAFALQGDSVSAESKGVPADFITIETYHPAGILMFIAQVLESWVSLIGFAILLGWYGIRLGRRNGETKRSFGRNLLSIFLFSTTATIAYLFIMLAGAQALIEMEAGEIQIARLHNYGSFMIVLALPFIIPIEMLFIGGIASLQYKAAPKE